MNKENRKAKFIIFLAAVFLLISTVESKAECRFWAAISSRIPEEVTLGQLLRLPNSLKYESIANDDGWGIGYYNGGEAIIVRGAGSAATDPNYDAAVSKIARLQPKIIGAHVRKATSGCHGPGVANPHPFKRYKNGKYWLFAHNGGGSKKIFRELIGEEYLNKNLPNTCTDDPPKSWVDSELYFIFLLKKIEDNNWDVQKGIQAALPELYAKLDIKGLNFFLSDGNTLWAFCHGRSLYYYHNSKSGYSIVASIYPDAVQGEWLAVPENTLVVMQPDSTPVLIPIP